MVNDMRRHSTATLMGMTKKELVEYVRMAEYNQDVAEETLKQQAENVKDWIPVIRCKNCKHWEWFGAESHKGVCTKCDCLMYDDDFCSYGERRSDNEK